MSIRPATVSDTDAVADLWVELAEGQRAHGSHLRSGENRDRIRESIGRHAISGGVVVASDADRIVGFVSFSMEQRLYETDADRGVVHNLFVSPENRGTGIGSRLLAAAEVGLVEEGAEAVSLETLAANEAARRFYRRHGYDPHRIEFEKRVETDNPPDR
ncbi:GNAT family N-acetyltransferase [Natronorarus salvus]|uniref:GNAT family N-acetyltransferase n=1 Tax=Natronorarus salvus TaxID=3117733 RepID=UPI0039081B31